MVRRGASGRWRFSTGAWVSAWSATSEESPGVKRDTKLLIVTVERGFKSRISCNFCTNHSSASSHPSTFEGIPQPCPESRLSRLWDSAAAVGCYSKARHTFYHMLLKALKFHDGADWDFLSMTHRVWGLAQQEAPQLGQALVDPIPSLFLHHWFQNLKREKKKC